MITGHKHALGWEGLYAPTLSTRLHFSRGVKPLPPFHRFFPCILWFLLMSSLPAAPRQWSVIETARDNGHRLTTLAAPVSATGAATGALVLDPAQKFQEMVGFGGALTESSYEKNRRQVKKSFDESFDTKFRSAIFTGPVLNNFFTYFSKPGPFSQYWNIAVHFSIDFYAFYHFFAISF